MTLKSMKCANKYFNSLFNKLIAVLISLSLIAGDSALALEVLSRGESRSDTLAPELLLYTDKGVPFQAALVCSVIDKRASVSEGPMDIADIQTWVDSYPLEFQRSPEFDDHVQLSDKVKFIRCGSELHVVVDNKYLIRYFFPSNPFLPEIYTNEVAASSCVFDRVFPKGVKQEIYKLEPEIPLTYSPKGVFEHIVKKAKLQDLVKVEVGAFDVTASQYPVCEEHPDGMVYMHPELIVDFDDMKRSGIGFNHVMPSGRVRWIDLADTVAYRVALHEFKLPRRETGGHGYRDADGRFAIDHDSELANMIAREYSVVDDAIWMWYLHSYKWDDSLRYDNKAFRRHLNLIFTSNNPTAMKMRAEFPNLAKDREKRREAIKLALKMNQIFFIARRDAGIETTPAFERRRGDPYAPSVYSPEGSVRAGDKQDARGMDPAGEFADMPRVFFEEIPDRSGGEKVNEIDSAALIHMRLTFILGRIRVLIATNREKREELRRKLQAGLRGQARKKVINDRAKELVAGNQAVRKLLLDLYYDMPVGIPGGLNKIKIRSEIAKNRMDLAKLLKRREEIRDDPAKEDPITRMDRAILHTRKKLLKLEMVFAGMHLNTYDPGKDDPYLMWGNVMNLLKKAIDVSSELESDLAKRMIRLSDRKTQRKYETVLKGQKSELIFRILGWEINLADESKELSSPVTKVKHLHIYPRTYLNGVRVLVRSMPRRNEPDMPVHELRAENIKEALVRLDCMIGSFTTGQAVTLDSRGEAARDLRTIKRMVEGMLPRINAPPAEWNEAYLPIKDAVRALVPKLPVESILIKRKIEFANLAALGRHFAHEIEGYIPEYSRVSECTSGLEDCAVMLERAYLWKNLAAKKRERIVLAMTKYRDWAANGMVRPKGYLGKFMADALELLEKDGFDNFPAIIKMIRGEMDPSTGKIKTPGAIDHLNRRLRAIDRIMDRESEVAKSTYDRMRDAEIKAVARKAAELTDDDKFDAALALLGEARKLYFSGTLIEPGYKRTEAAIRKVEGYIRGAANAGKDGFRKVVISAKKTVIHDLAGIKDDIEKKNMFRITVHLPDGTSAIQYRTPGITVAGLLRMMRIRETDVQVSLGGTSGWLKPDGLKAKLNDLAVVRINRKTRATDGANYRGEALGGEDSEAQAKQRRITIKNIYREMMRIMAGIVQSQAKGLKGEFILAENAGDIWYPGYFLVTDTESMPSVGGIAEAVNAVNGLGTPENTLKIVVTDPLIIAEVRRKVEALRGQGIQYEVISFDDMKTGLGIGSGKLDGIEELERTVDANREDAEALAITLMDAQDKTAANKTLFGDPIKNTVLWGDIVNKELIARPSDLWTFIEKLLERHSLTWEWSYHLKMAALISYVQEKGDTIPVQAARRKEILRLFMQFYRGVDDAGMKGLYGKIAEYYTLLQRITDIPGRELTERETISGIEKELWGGMDRLGASFDLEKFILEIDDKIRQLKRIFVERLTRNNVAAAPAEAAGKGAGEEALTEQELLELLDLPAESVQAARTVWTPLQQAKIPDAINELFRNMFDINYSAMQADTDPNSARSKLISRVVEREGTTGGALLSQARRLYRTEGETGQSWWDKAMETAGFSAETVKAIRKWNPKPDRGDREARWGHDEASRILWIIAYVERISGTYGDILSLASNDKLLNKYSREDIDRLIGKLVYSSRVDRRLYGNLVEGFTDIVLALNMRNRGNRAEYLVESGSGRIGFVDLVSEDAAGNKLYYEVKLGHAIGDIVQQIRDRIEVFGIPAGDIRVVSLEEDAAVAQALSSLYVAGSTVNIPVTYAKDYLDTIEDTLRGFYGDLPSKETAGRIAGTLKGIFDDLKAISAKEDIIGQNKLGVEKIHLIFRNIFYNLDDLIASPAEFEGIMSKVRNLLSRLRQESSGDKAAEAITLSQFYSEVDSAIEAISGLGKYDRRLSVAFVPSEAGYRSKMAIIKKANKSGGATGAAAEREFGLHELKDVGALAEGFGGYSIFGFDAADILKGVNFDMLSKLTEAIDRMLMNEVTIHGERMDDNKTLDAAKIVSTYNLYNYERFMAELYILNNAINFHKESIQALSDEWLGSFQLFYRKYVKLGDLPLVRDAVPYEDWRQRNLGGELSEARAFDRETLEAMRHFARFMNRLESGAHEKGILNMSIWDSISDLSRTHPKRILYEMLTCARTEESGQVELDKLDVTVHIFGRHRDAAMRWLGMYKTMDIDTLLAAISGEPEFTAVCDEHKVCWLGIFMRMLSVIAQVASAKVQAGDPAADYDPDPASTKEGREVLTVARAFLAKAIMEMGAIRTKGLFSSPEGKRAVAYRDESEMFAPREFIPLDMGELAAFFRHQAAVASVEIMDLDLREAARWFSRRHNMFGIEFNDMQSYLATGRPASSGPAVAVRNDINQRIPGLKKLLSLVFEAGKPADIFQGVKHVYIKPVEGFINADSGDILVDRGTIEAVMSLTEEEWRIAFEGGERGRMLKNMLRLIAEQNRDGYVHGFLRSGTGSGDWDLVPVKENEFASFDKVYKELNIFGKLPVYMYVDKRRGLVSSEGMSGDRVIVPWEKIKAMRPSGLTGRGINRAAASQKYRYFYDALGHIVHKMNTSDNSKYGFIYASEDVDTPMFFTTFVSDKYLQLENIIPFLNEIDQISRAGVKIPFPKWIMEKLKAKAKARSKAEKDREKARKKKEKDNKHRKDRATGGAEYRKLTGWEAKAEKEVIVASAVTYIENNIAAVKETLSEEAPVMLRMPVEKLEEIGVDNAKSLIGALQAAKCVSVELFYSTKRQDVTAAEYKRYDVIVRDFSAERTRENTITLFVTDKKILLSSDVEIMARIGGEFDMPPLSSILVPVGMKGDGGSDLTGLLRSTVLGVMLMKAAREGRKGDIKPELVKDIRQKLMELCEDTEAEEFNFDGDNILGLVNGNINKVIDALNKLIVLLPMEPLDTQELKALYDKACSIIRMA
ncbi:MAG: hypothetical protein HQL30_11180 [Candidatus Omnitrophica bacterium]|nr:hypothetical protein [Candidatus Omnitrophota bacterium]